MTYDYRNRTASQEKFHEYMENLMSMCGDACSECAEPMHDELSKDTPSDALSAPSKLSKDIWDNLNIASGAEKLEDIVGCVRDAQADLIKLEAALKVAKKEAKAGDEPDETALEAIDEATQYIRQLKRDLKSIESEIADAPDEDEDESE